MKLKLNSQDLLTKKFIGNVKGYDMDEVDQFLDIILEDYKNFESVLSETNNKINVLKRDNESLKSQIRKKDLEISAQKSKNIYLNKDKSGSIDNLELLKRCSTYEKKLYQLGVDPSKIK